MRVRVLDSLTRLPADAWNRLIPGSYPFIRHEFLAALEQHGCATPAQGWTPHHLVAEDADGNIIGFAPGYLKSHSYGEFVFDFSWAEASHRIGRAYYPKLICAVPFNPVTGPRLVAAAAETRSALARAIRREAETSQLSSAHALFLEEEDAAAFQDAGYLLRRDCHFQWRNRGYADFEAFLATLSSAQRKKIRRERRRVVEAGIHIEVRETHTLDEPLWRDVYRFYSNTYHERGQPPYLTYECLRAIAVALGSEMRIFLARDGGRAVGAAICFVGGDTLYGRHWGCAEQYHSLHFETCYYQGIEYCIRHGLARYDAGAQGEHKLQRGFEPVVTCSAHWIAEPRLAAAIADFLNREVTYVDAYVRDKTRSSPSTTATAS